MFKNRPVVVPPPQWAPPNGADPVAALGLSALGLPDALRLARESHERWYTVMYIEGDGGVLAGIAPQFVAECEEEPNLRTALRSQALRVVVVPRPVPAPSPSLSALPLPIMTAAHLTAIRSWSARPASGGSPRFAPPSRPTVSGGSTPRVAMSLSATFAAT